MMPMRFGSICHSLAFERTMLIARWPSWKPAMQRGKASLRAQPRKRCSKTPARGPEASCDFLHLPMRRESSVRHYDARGVQIPTELVAELTGSAVAEDRLVKDFDGVQDP